ncbi:MAG: RNB domain-containing ribonuclease [Lentisphaeria bacterium]|nr:RNB domain-containing ribonuclease [Lentisphaeria bacterium]
MNIGLLAVYKGKAATVTGVNKEKIDIRCADGESRSVRLKDIEVIHPGPVASLNFVQLPEPDWQEIAELSGEEGFSFAEFTELAYGTNSAAAAWQAWNVLKEGVFFTGSVADGVKVQDPEKTAELLQKLNEKENKKKLREELLERIRSNSITPDDLKFLREIEAVGNGESENSSLLKELGIESVPQKAHTLLCRLGVWQELYDPWPRRLGVDINMPTAVLPQSCDDERVDMTAHTSYAIDDAGSNDPDDAIAFVDGLLYVHVADPAAAIVPGSEADEESSWRGESSYLPEILSPMLPEGAVERFGLGLSETSPAMTFAVRITDDGKAVLEKILLSTIHAERHSYESARNTLMKSDEFIAMQNALERFKQCRAENGALFIKLPEVKTKVQDGKITVSPCPVTPERELVANAMLCAGAAVADFMAREGIPFPFVTQGEPEIDRSTLGDSLADMFQLRRNCAAGVTGIIPGKHSGLGLEPYSRVTSPLRRYADLLAHQQIRRFLKKEPLLELEYIAQRLARAEEAANQRHKLEKYANEYFLLHYLKQHPEWQGNGTVVDKQGDRLTVLIPEFAYCYKCRFNTGLKEGDEVELNFNASDPAELRLSLRVNKLQSSGESSGL